ncbi:MAG: thioredoxin domain-containing protein [Actinomycetota bacterium]
MTRVLILLALTAVAVGIAYLLQRRRPDPPSAPSYRAPSQLDRDDFLRPEAPILVAVFASTTCDTCPRAWETVQAVAGRYADLMSVQRIDVQDDPDTHKRYRIDGVPTTVVADPEGVVQEAFFGPMTDEQLLGVLPPAPEGR